MSSQLYRTSSTQRKVASGLLSLVLFGATQLSHADAVPMTLQNTAGAWTTYTLAPNPVSYAGSLVQVANYAGTNGAVMNGLFWGESIQSGGPQSALLFNPTSNGSAVTLGAAFALGTLTHYNYSIWSDTAITNANLALQVSLAGTGSVTTGPFNYNFSIFETANSGACPAWQVSSTLCDDKISFSAASSKASNSASMGSFIRSICWDFIKIRAPSFPT